MTIARRMLLLIGTGIVSLILLGCIGLFQINRVYEKTNYGNTNIVPSIQIISLAILEFSHIRVRLYRHVLSSDEKLQADLTQKIKEARSKLEGTLNAYEPLVADAEDQRRRDHQIINLYAPDTKRGYKLELQRKSDGGAEWSVRYDRAIERDRLCDWLRWQKVRFYEFLDHAAAHGTEALTRLLIDEMFETERRIKKEGRGAGGMRPLRMWRGD